MASCPLAAEAVSNPSSWRRWETVWTMKASSSTMRTRPLLVIYYSPFIKSSSLMKGVWRSGEGPAVWYQRTFASTEPFENVGHRAPPSGHMLSGDRQKGKKIRNFFGKARWTRAACRLWQAPRPLLQLRQGIERFARRQIVNGQGPQRLQQLLRGVLKEWQLSLRGCWPGLSRRRCLATVGRLELCQQLTRTLNDGPRQSR